MTMPMLILYIYIWTDFTGATDPFQAVLLMREIKVV